MGSIRARAFRALLQLALPAICAAAGSGPCRADAARELDLGHYSAALSAARDARHRDHQRGDLAAEKEDLNDIGLALLYTGSYAGAAEMFQQALAFDRRLRDAFGETVRLNNLGNVAFFQARYRDADQCYRAARAVLETNRSAPWHPKMMGRTLANQAVLAQRLGQYDQAREMYADLSRELSGSERARMLANQGSLLRRLGDPYLSLDAYRAAEQIFARERNSDGEIGLLKNHGIVLTADLGRPRDALPIFGRALDLAERSSNRREVLQLRLYCAEALRRLGRISEARVEATAAYVLARRLHSVEDEWKALYLLGRVDDAHALEDFELAIGLIEGTLTDLSLPAFKRDYLADKREVYDAAIARLLDGPPDRLFEMLERSRARSLEKRYPRASLAMVQGRLDPGTVIVECWSGNRRRAALLISRDRAFVIPWTAPDAEEIIRFAGPSLRRVIVSPDAGSPSVPFETLRTADGRFLIEQTAVSYLPCAAMLVHNRYQNRRRAPWAKDTLAVAVSGSPAGSNETPMRPALIHAEQEARDVLARAGGAGQLATGSHATADLLRSPDYPVVHVAAHSVANPYAAEGSRLLLGSGPAYLRDIYGWDLSRVQLITLSACETENGEFIRGEGTAGFSRALLYAGARTTITTLWPVADEPTAEFMRIFYERFRAGGSATDALRYAKLRFLRSTTRFRDPKYWAAFVLTGDPTIEAPAVVPWFAVVGCALLASSAVILAITGIRGHYGRGRKEAV